MQWVPSLKYRRTSFIVKLTDRQKDKLAELDPTLKTDNMTVVEAARMIDVLATKKAQEANRKVVNERGLKVGDIVTNGRETCTIRKISPTGVLTFHEKKRGWGPNPWRKV